MKKILFYIGLAVVTFVVTLTLLSQRLDSAYMIEKDILIEGSIDDVFKQVGDLKNWQNWSPWKKKDPSLEYTFEGEKSDSAGSVMKWKSASNGAGSVTLLQVSSPNVVSYKLQFDDWSNQPTGEISLIKMVDQVKVVWTMRGERGFVDKIFWTLFKAEAALNEDFELGLQLLKTNIETQE